MKNRPYHHGDLPAALLERAEQTLRERGSSALSLRELARDVGVSTTAPSRHFKTKQALLDALAVTGFERLAASLAASQDGVGESFAERLDAVARAYVHFASTNVALLRLMYSVKHGPEASDELQATAYLWARQIVDLISEGQRRGEVRQGSLEQVALPVFATLHGYAGMTVSGMVPPEMSQHGLDNVLLYILRGCTPDGIYQ